MELFILNHSFKYEVDKICRIFFPLIDIKILYEFDFISNHYIKTEIQEQKILIEYLYQDKKFYDTINISDDMDVELTLCKLLFGVLKQATNISPQWGMLTGIRPVKLLRNKALELKDIDLAGDYIKSQYDTDISKIELIKSIYKIEEPIIKDCSNKDFSLYISIPFCPSRCSYCTFVSKITDRQGGLITEYLHNLIKEIKQTASLAKRLDLRLKSIYIGGGTPTMLQAEQITELLSIINTEFLLADNIEFTFEAGRPDTIDAPKLQAMKEQGVNRISVNPQTLNEQALQAIGRNHTVDEFFDAYNLVKQHNFNCINVDLIAGLPQDTLNTFKSTVKKIVELAPQNITLHTLALKRSSDINRNELSNWSNFNLATEMIDWAANIFDENSYLPYYLYRQSRTASGLENIGFTQAKHINKYNIYMMEEVHTILACGSNAVSKLVNPHSGKLERIFNYKFTNEYINGIDEMIARKNAVIKFYESYLNCNEN